MPTKVELQQYIDTDIWIELGEALNLEEITTKEGFITYVKKIQDKNADQLNDIGKLISLIEGYKTFVANSVK